MEYLLETKKRIEQYGCEAVYWERGTRYNLDKDVKGCDAFVLILPANAWEYERDCLPIGCSRELDTAESFGKKIYLSYRNTSGSHNLYEVYEDCLEDSINGKGGTSGNVYKNLSVMADNAKSALTSRRPLILEDSSPSFKGFREDNSFVPNHYSNELQIKERDKRLLLFLHV